MASFTLTATAHSRQADQETNHQQSTGGVTSTDTPNNLSRRDALTLIPEENCSKLTLTTATYSVSGNSAPLCTLDSALPRESEDQLAKRLAAAQARRHRRQAMQNKALKSKSVVSTARHIYSTTTQSSLEPSALTYTAPLPVAATQRVRRLILMLNYTFEHENSCFAKFALTPEFVHYVFLVRVRTE
jgi:hypothetical protein